jgi:hypothetical protein
MDEKISQFFDLVEEWLETQGSSDRNDPYIDRIDNLLQEIRSALIEKSGKQ